MIDYEVQIRIQAFLDGELSEGEAREIASLIARDQDAADLHAELKNTRRALAGAEDGVRVPETREFYWSKIRREIERTERIQPVAPSGSLWHSLMRLWRPVTVAGGVVLLGWFAFLQFGNPSPARGGSATEVLVASVDAEAITFRDETDDTTFVWFTYPAENGVAKGSGANTFN
jgi:anti-sigma factor RsiW